MASWDEPAEPPPKEEMGIKDYITLVCAVGGLFVSLIREATNISWLKWVAWGLVGIGIPLVLSLLWRKILKEFINERRKLKNAREKAAFLPDYVRRFKHDILSQENMGSIAYQVCKIDSKCNTTGTNVQELGRLAGHLKELTDILLVRMEEPIKNLLEIQLVFSSFDTMVRFVQELYKDQWRPFLRSNRGSIHDDIWAKMVKAREVYAKFTDDYTNFRKSKNKDANAIGSGFYFEIPDPL